MNDREPQELDDRTLRDLARLADGELSGKRRLELERQIEHSPELATALERQRSAIAALRGLDLEAPVALRNRIESERERPSARLRRKRLSIAGGLAAATAAAVLFAVLVLPSNAGGPSVVEAAQLSDLPATQASVPVDPANPKLLAAAGDGVPFPNLAAMFGWRQAGARSDELDGRDTKTVFYERDGKRIGYTIVSGNAIAWPKDARKTNVNGVLLRSTADGPRQIVTWLRDGRTCVMSGKGVSDAELSELASWKGEGSVPF
jgi:hypothetical protein